VRVRVVVKPDVRCLVGPDQDDGGDYDAGEYGANRDAYELPVSHGVPSAFTQRGSLRRPRDEGGCGRG
jgi:hypothetical protein